jgi:hypothetical protein
MTTKHVILVTTLLCLCTGCASHHYTTTTGNSVSFYLKHPNAEHVQFSSSIDRYRIHDVKQNISGVWEFTLPQEREFNYFYLVDGSYYIPDCKNRQTDDFGAENCLYLP